MIVTWIVITLLIAVVVGIIAAGVMHEDFGAGFAFSWGFVFVCNASFWIGVIYVVAHFVNKAW